MKPFCITLIVVALLCCCGCDRNVEVSGAGEVANRRNALRPPAPINSELQQAINNVSIQSFELDPKKRPVVISDRAKNRKDWGNKLLLEGYEQSGHKDARWDATVTSGLRLTTLTEPANRTASEI